MENGHRRLSNCPASVKVGCPRWRRLCRADSLDFPNLKTAFASMPRCAAQIAFWLITFLLIATPCSPASQAGRTRPTTLTDSILELSPADKPTALALLKGCDSATAHGLWLRLMVEAYKAQTARQWPRCFFLYEIAAE